MRKTILHTDQLNQQFRQQLVGLWPALKGSLAQIHKPCIRKHCPVCTRGDKHPAWMLAFKDQAGRRRGMYVPQDLVADLRQALVNGRKIEQLLSSMGPRLIKAYRQQRDRGQNPT
jgi:hypothetical protein